MKGVTVFSLGVCLAAMMPVGATARDAVLPDLSKVDRRIKKEPAYTAEQPLYALYVFGPQADTRVWAVLDKSRPDAPHYDVLYFDRNADGDLTTRRSSKSASLRIAGAGRRTPACRFGTRKAKIRSPCSA